MRLQAASVEKDFWICWTLHELFALLEIGPHLTFKGGTSLSKAWKLIERFSEDIDLIVDKQTLGFGGDASPDKAPSKKQRKLRLEALMEACRHWVQKTLQPALAARISAELGQTGWKLEVDPDMDDGQYLLFHYPGVFAPTEAGYVRPVVKIELGARSDDWPHQEKPIQPYLAEVFPQLAMGATFPVRVLAAERTFWEKALLLHEETFRPADKPRKTVRRLPAIGDSQIDSQTLVADRPTVSPSVLGMKSIKVGKTVGNIVGNHHLSLAVTNGHKNQNGGVF